jgi:hypothetical protein
LTIFVGLHSCLDADITASRVKQRSNLCKGKSTVHPRTGHEGPEGDYIGSSTLSFTSSLDGCWWSKSRPCHCTPGKYPVPVIKQAWYGIPRPTPAFKIIYVKEI